MGDRGHLWQRLVALIPIAAVHWLSILVVSTQAIDPKDTVYKILIGPLIPEPWALILKGLWVVAGVAALALVFGAKRTWKWSALPFLIVFADLVLNLVACELSARASW